jgi:hypothetical protein
MLRKISLYACAAILLSACQSNGNTTSSNPTSVPMCVIRSPYSMYSVPMAEISFHSGSISFNIDNGAKQVRLSNYSLECEKVIKGEEND